MIIKRMGFYAISIFHHRLFYILKMIFVLNLQLHLRIPCFSQFQEQKHELHVNLSTPYSAYKFKPDLCTPPPIHQFKFSLETEMVSLHRA